MQKSFIFVKEFENTYFKGKKFCKARDHCHCTGNIEVLHIANVI